MKYNPVIVAEFFIYSGLPAPMFEYAFATPERKWRFDISFIPQKLAVEVEGGVWTGGRHVRGSGFKKDMEKYNEATRRGWRVLRFVPAELCTHDTVELIKECLKPKEEK